MLCITGFGEVFRKDKNEKIDYGDIVCIKADGLVHKVNDNSDLDRIIGICSNTIGFELSGGMQDVPEDEQVEVEMLGQIWVNTDCEFIEPGMRLKALSTGKVGIAFENDKKFGIALTGVVDGKVRIVYNIYQ